MFACHLHNSSGMCLHLAQANPLTFSKNLKDAPMQHFGTLFLVVLNSSGKKRRAGLYCPKSAVIVLLYSRKSAVIFPEERGYISVLKIVATVVSACSQGQCTHSAQTNFWDFNNCGNKKKKKSGIIPKIVEPSLMLSAKGSARTPFRPKLWPPSFLPAAKGSARTLLRPIVCHYHK
jgi:hypothetical protein